MKKSIAIFILLLSVIVSAAQTVPRSFVMLEIATGTWCYYCPGAALGADDLVEGGASVAVIENHNGDPFANQYSNARNNYYNVPGFPTAYFDGILSVVGGNHTTSMIGSYVPKYLQRIATPSNILMDMQMSNSGLNYSAVITMTRIGNLTATNMKLRFAVTVSNIAYTWQGQTNLNFVNAKMVPDADGTSISFSGGDVQTVTLDFALDATWPVEDIEFIAFIQNDQGKEILQGFKRAAIDLNVDLSASASQVNKNDEVTFTNNTIGGFLHAPEIYHWEFPGATPDTSNLENPVVTYTECGTHPVTLVVNRGGQIDTVTKMAYIHVGPVVAVTALPNDTACSDVPITLDATTSNAASYLWQPGGAVTPSIVVGYPEYSLGAHTFSVVVTGNDGCLTTETATIFIDECTGMIPPEPGMSLSIFPNPSSGTFTIRISNPVEMTADLSVTTILGNVIHQEHGLLISKFWEKEVTLAPLNQGIYFLTLTSGEYKTVRKIFVK